MNIYAEKGDKVKFLGCSEAQINYGSCDDPNCILTEGKIYEIDHTEVYSWHTKVILAGFEEYAFNSVCFEDAG